MRKFLEMKVHRNNANEHTSSSDDGISRSRDLLGNVAAFALVRLDRLGTSRGVEMVTAVKGLSSKERARG